MVALMLVPILMALGGAIDLGVAYYLKARLGYAVDAAALSVGSTIDDDVNIRDRAQAFLEANYPSTAVGTLLLDDQNFTVTENDNVVTISAKASFDTFFLKLFNRPTITVAASGEVIRAVKGMDVALVLDVTGSMTGSKIRELRSASRALLETLFGSQSRPENLFVSIVPYSASVNPGGEVGSAPSGVSLDVTSSEDSLDWKGCVMAKYDLTSLTSITKAQLTGGSPPSSEGITWDPMYFAPDKDNNYDPADATTVESSAGTERQNAGRGPNLGCPAPIQPLTNDRDFLLSYVGDSGTVGELDSWHRGGTLSDIGMAWGIRTLMGDTEPFDEGESWGKDRWIKVIVMMTDGENQMYWQGSDAGSNSTNHEAWSDQTAYGRMDEFWVGIGKTMPNTLIDPAEDSSDRNTNKSRRNSLKGDATDEINDRLTALCDYADGLDTLVYTVTFGGSVSSGVQAIYQNCASSEKPSEGIPAGMYIHADEGALTAAFSEIGRVLSNLRVSK
jgi:Flp pilus assembly protein TadG